MINGRKNTFPAHEGTIADCEVVANDKSVRVYWRPEPGAAQKLVTLTWEQLRTMSFPTADGAIPGTRVEKVLTKLCEVVTDAGFVPPELPVAPKA